MKSIRLDENETWSFSFVFECELYYHREGVRTTGDSIWQRANTLSGAQ